VCIADFGFRIAEFKKQKAEILLWERLSPPASPERERWRAGSRDLSISTTSTIYCSPFTVYDFYDFYGFYGFYGSLLTSCTEPVEGFTIYRSPFTTQRFD
jgi:hypothetical protein